MSKFHFTALCAAAVCLARTASAGTIDGTTVITGDADSGIASSKTYTHAFAFDTIDEIVINGVAFTPVPAAISLTGPYHVLTDAPNAGATNGETWVEPGDGIDTLLQHFRYGGAPQTTIIDGLIPGVSYNFRIYYRKWAAGVRECTLTFDEGAGTQTVTIDQDAADEASYVSYTYTAVQGPYPGVALPLKVSIRPTENASAGATWHLYGLTNEVLTTPAPGDPDVYYGRVTSDNHFAVYLGREDGSNLRLLARDSVSDWQSPEPVVMDYRPGDYIYVAAWDNPGAINDPAMWIGEFDVPGAPATLLSNAAQWVAVEGPANSNPGSLVTDPPPSATAISTLAAGAQWAPPEAFAFNTDAPWGGNAGISSVYGMNDAEFLWHDTFDNVSSSNTNETYVLFRSAAVILEGVDVLLSRQHLGSSATAGTKIADLSGFNTAAPADTFTFALAAGAGDTDNAKFQVSGSELRAGSFDFSSAPEGTNFSIRLRATGAGNATGERAFILTVQSDADSDDLPDAWEMATAGNLTDLTGLATGPGPGAGSGDFDGDSLSDRQEYELSVSDFPGIDPTKADTDGDGLPDNVEIAGAAPRPPTDPTLADTDGDGLPDPVESNSGTFVSAADPGTSPLNPDTDGDGYPDGFEVARESNPLDASSIPPARLVGYWPFDADGATQPDVSGNGNHASPFGGVTWLNDPARNGGVMDFDGLDSYLEAPDTDSLSVSTALTIAAWVNPADLSGFCGIVGKSAGPNLNLPAPYDLYLLQNSGVPRFYTGNGVDQYTSVDGVSAFFEGEWHHLAVTIDGTEVAIYFDGLLDNTGTSGAARADGGNPLRIGSRMDLFVDMWGQLDDVAIFEGALSEQQIQTIMSGDFSAFGVGEPQPPAAGFAVTQVTLSQAGTVTIVFESETGASYSLERSDNLQTWTTVPPVLLGGAGSTTEVTDTPPAGASRIYYRVRRTSP